MFFSFLVLVVLGSITLGSTQLEENITMPTPIETTLSPNDMVISLIHQNYPKINCNHFDNGILVEINNLVTRNTFYCQLGIIFRYKPLFKKLFEIKTILNTILTEVVAFKDDNTFTWNKTEPFGSRTSDERDKFCLNPNSGVERHLQTYHLKVCKQFATNVFLTVYESRMSAVIRQFNTRNEIISKQLREIQIAYALDKFVKTDETVVTNDDIDDTFYDIEGDSSGDYMSVDAISDPVIISPLTNPITMSTLIGVDNPQVINDPRVVNDPGIIESPRVVNDQLNSEDPIQQPINNQNILAEENMNIVTVPTITPVLTRNMPIKNADRKKRSIQTPTLAHVNIPTQIPRSPGVLSFLTQFYQNIVDLATRSDVDKIHLALEQLYSVDNDITLFSHETIAVLMTHQAQIKLLTESVSNLITLAENSAAQLKIEFTKHTSDKMKEAHFKSIYLNTLFIQLSVLQADVQNEVMRLSTGIREAIKGIITTEALPPGIMYKALTIFETKFNNFKYLWEIPNINSVDKIYKRTHTKYIELGTGNSSLLVLNIPIINPEFLGRHITIHASPFKFENDGSQLKVSLLSNDPDKLEVVEFGNIIYEILPGDITSNPDDSVDALVSKTLRVIDPQYYKCIHTLFENTFSRSGSINKPKIFDNCEIKSDYSLHKLARPHPNILTYFSATPAPLKIECLSKTITDDFEITEYNMTGLGLKILGSSCTVEAFGTLMVPDPITIATSNTIWESDIKNLEIPNATASAELVMGIMKNIDNISKEVILNLYKAIGENLPSFENLNNTDKLVYSMKQKLIEIDSKNAFSKVIIQLMSRPTAISLTFISIIFAISLVTMTFIFTKLGIFSCMKRGIQKCCCPTQHNLIKYETQNDIEILFRHADEYVTTQITTSLAD